MSEKSICASPPETKQIVCSLVQQVALEGQLVQSGETAQGVEIRNLVVAEIELHESI